MSEQRKTLISAVFGALIVLGAVLSAAWTAYIGMRFAASEPASEA